MRYSKNKEVAALVQTLVKSGWQYMNGKTHGRLIAPSGRKLAVPGTPSDRRAYMNFRQDTRRLASVAEQ
jgi:hypothetical protein